MVSLARLTAMTKAAKPEVRQDGVWRMTVRAQRRRSEPARLLPLIRPLLDDPDERVRSGVVQAFRRCGSASLRYADDVARVAARYPQVARSTGFTPEYHAMVTLVRLGDARWVDIVGRLAVMPHPNLLPDDIPRSPHVFDAVRGRLSELAAAPPGHPAISLLAHALGSWGRDAAAAIPDLLAVLPDTPMEKHDHAVTRALVRLGCDDPGLVPHLRALLAEQPDEDEADPFDVEAAHAVWHLANDVQPLMELLHKVLAPDGPIIRQEHHDAVSDVGRELHGLAPAATAHLTRAPAETVEQREQQVLAARLVWVATGDSAGVLPTVRAVLASGGWPVLPAADLVADLADAGVDLADAVPILRALLRDRLVRAAAARALWRLGVAPAKLTAPLLDNVKAGWHRRGDPISVLVEMGAVGAIPRLEKLASRNKRLVDSGVDDDIVWEDEALQAKLREAIKNLRSSRYG